MASAIPKFDDAGTWVGSSYVYATARDFARFGELYRNDGIAESGASVLPAGWADHGRTFVAHDPTGAGRHGFDYGRHWWMWPEFAGSIAAHGYEGQFIVVVPDRALTVVHLGKTDFEVRPTLASAIGEMIDAAPDGLTGLRADRSESELAHPIEQPVDGGPVVGPGAAEDRRHPALAVDDHVAAELQRVAVEPHVVPPRAPQLDVTAQRPPPPHPPPVAAPEPEHSIRGA